MTTPDMKPADSHERRDFIELVGLAGAGKSTLAAALEQQVKEIEIIAPPNLRSPRMIPFFIRNILLVLPMLAAILRECGWKAITRQEIATLVIMNGWADWIQARSRGKACAFLVDQGPISYLAMLERLNSPWRATKAGRQWIEKMLDRWSQVISMVVMLDASNEVLVERIRSRAQEHTLQRATFEKASIVLELYRVIYPTVINGLKARNPKLTLLSYTTTAMPKDDLHRQVTADIRRAIALEDKGAC